MSLIIMGELKFGHNFSKGGAKIVQVWGNWSGIGGWEAPAFAKGWPLSGVYPL